MRVETVKIADPDKKGDYIIINASDFNEKQHKLFAKETAEGDEEEPEHEPEDGPVLTNASGTFDEPTPSDVRYAPDNTEFENNHRLGLSAAEARDALKMPQEPGGLHPQVHKDLKVAEEDFQAARDRAAHGKVSRIPIAKRAEQVKTGHGKRTGKAAVVKAKGKAGAED